MSAVELARVFAARLDAADEAGARALLAEDCEYLFRGRIVRGSGEIASMYASAHADALRTFDGIAYESEVREDGDGAAVIRFADVLTCAGLTHRHECEQRVAARDGRIVRIEHRDLPGEHEALNAFLGRAGLPARPPIAGQ